MNYQPVKSSNIAEIGYDNDNQTLGVKFKNGSHYVYSEVPEDKHINLMNAESIGRFFHSQIKGQFPAENQNKTEENTAE